MMDDRAKKVFTALEEIPPRDTLLIGIGNSLKADDGIGPAVCWALKDCYPENVIDAGAVPENYIQVIINRAPKVILFIDAIDFGATPGTVRFFNPGELSEAAISTHALSPRLLSDMISQDISARIYFLGIQPKSMKMGEPISPEIESTMKEIVKLFDHLFALNNSA